MKRTLIVTAAVAALLSAASGAAQAAPADKELCKSGGFANYVDPTTDLPFKNQGRCVSFVNSGGTLVPVQEEPPVPISPTAKLSVGEYLDGTFPVTVEAQGSPNIAYELTVGGEARNVTTSVDGLATFTVNVQPETTFEVRHAGQVLGSITTPAAPIEEGLTFDFGFGNRFEFAANLCPVYLLVTGGDPWEIVAVERDTGLQSGSFDFPPLNDVGLRDAQIGTAVDGSSVTVTVDGITKTKTVACQD